MSAPRTAALETAIDAVAAGLADPSAIWRAATALMRCRRHGGEVVVLDGARGGLCLRCLDTSVAPDSEANKGEEQ